MAPHHSTASAALRAPAFLNLGTKPELVFKRIRLFSFRICTNLKWNCKMPQNVDVKANVKDIKKVKAVAEELSQSDGKLIVQEDTFFLVPNGRLKLREIQGDTAELIFYKRSDTASAKLSEFQTTEVPDPHQLKCVLEQALGVRGVLKKQRLLYMVGQTRIHVDQVEGLGHFMELEVGLGEGDTVDGGKKIAQDLMDKLGVSKTDLIAVAYIDLLLAQTNK